MAIDFKTISADTTFGSGAFLFGADSQSASEPSLYSESTVFGYLLGLANTWTNSQTINTGEKTASAPILDMSQTWNNGAVTFTGIKSNVTDTASASGSLLMDLQVGGSSNLQVSKGGLVRARATAGGFGLIGSNSKIASWGVDDFAFYNSSGVSVFAMNNSSGALWLGSDKTLCWGTNVHGGGGTADLLLTRRGAASLRLGAADAASPVAQTLGVQSVVAGTTNTAGANFTIAGSQGTGTGAGGSIIFQVAPAGSSGTAQNALVEAFRIQTGTRIRVAAASIEGAFGSGFYSLDNTAIGFGQDAGSVVWGGIAYNGFVVSNALYYGFGSSGTSLPDLFLTRRGAANLRLGAADAASPVAQTLSVQSVVAGTTNTAGANFTIAGSQGTGSGAGGSIIFQIAPAGSSGTAQNALATAVEIRNNLDASFKGEIKSFGDYFLRIQGAVQFSDVLATRTDGALGTHGASVVVAAHGALGWSNTDYNPITPVDLRLFRDAANTLALGNGTNAQTFRVYNTYTDASNYERGFVRYVSNRLEIGHEGLGTGSNSRTIAFRTQSFDALTLSTTTATFNVNLALSTASINSMASILNQTGYTQMQETTAPAAPAANRVRIYAEDNGSGKTRLMALFPTGAAVQIAIEP